MYKIPMQLPTICTHWTSSTSLKSIEKAKKNDSNHSKNYPTTSFYGTVHVPPIMPVIIIFNFQGIFFQRFFFSGILSQGLRIAPPEAPVTGYMFGKGVYFADMVSKSANYCQTTRTNNTGLLLLCDVALGNMYDRNAADYITKLPSGKHSCRGIFFGFFYVPKS